MPQGIPTGHSCSKRIYAFAVLARACIGKRHVLRRRRKALLRVPVGGNAARHSHRTLMLLHQPFSDCYGAWRRWTKRRARSSPTTIRTSSSGSSRWWKRGRNTTTLPRKRKHGKSGNREGERQAPFLFPPQVKKSVVSIRQFVDKTPADGI